MKILQVHNFYRIRGGECSVVDEENKLLKNAGHEVVQFSRQSQDIDKTSIFNKIKSFINIPFNKSIYNEVINQFKYNKPDVAHIHNVFPLISPSIYSALHDLEIPIVQTLHNYRFLCPNAQFFTKGNICQKCTDTGFKNAFTNRCIRNNYAVSALYATAISRLWRSGVIPGYIDQFIALNNFVSNKMKISGVPNEKISICGNFIAPLASKVVEPKDYILYLGRLSAEKGIHTLLRAVSSLPGVVLKVAGSGPEEEALKSYVLKNSQLQVEFLGHMNGDAKIKLIAEAKCMIVPSEWYENFPISILESLSLGTPVIASDIGGLSDMIVSEKTGLLFKAGDYFQLAECIKKLISDTPKLEKMSKYSIEYAKSYFGPEQHLHQLIDIYSSAIKNRNQ